MGLRFLFLFIGFTQVTHKKTLQQLSSNLELLSPHILNNFTFSDKTYSAISGIHVHLPCPTPILPLLSLLGLQMSDSSSLACEGGILIREGEGE